MALLNKFVQRTMQKYLAPQQEEPDDEALIQAEEVRVRVWHFVARQVTDRLPAVRFALMDEGRFRTIDRTRGSLSTSRGRHAMVLIIVLQS